jgi:hypothetical protein
MPGPRSRQAPTSPSRELIEDACHLFMVEVIVEAGGAAGAGLRGLMGGGVGKAWRTAEFRYVGSRTSPPLQHQVEPQLPLRRGRPFAVAAADQADSIFVAGLRAPFESHRRVRADRIEQLPAIAFDDPKDLFAHYSAKVGSFICAANSAASPRICGKAVLVPHRHCRPAGDETGGSLG